MDCFVGQILPWAIPWAPSGWCFCDGRLLPIREYQALYALIRNTYGGSYEQSTFAVPNLCNAVVVGSNSMGADALGALHAFSMTPVPAAGQSAQGAGTAGGQGTVVGPAAAASFTVTPKLVGLNWIIALTGVWPSRD